MPQTIQQTPVDALRTRLAQGDACQLIDVREFAEYATEHIAQAQLMPLLTLAQHAGEIDPQRPVYLVCRSGKRAQQAAEQLQQRGHADVRVVEGGLQAWLDAGYPVERGARRVWSLERQVRFVAGIAVLLSVGLAGLIHPWFLALAVFIGGGLTFAAVTDTCGMGMMLARMPWNQRS